MSRGEYGNFHALEFAYSRTGSRRYPPYVAFRYRKKGNAAYITSTALTLRLGLEYHGEHHFRPKTARSKEPYPLAPVSCMNIFASATKPLGPRVNSAPAIACRAASETMSA